MHAKTKHKQLAENLRRQGLSYSEIKKQVPVAKSSLSLWLRGISLNSEQRKRLERLNTIGQKAGAKARHMQKIERLCLLKEAVNKEVPKFIRDPFFVLGLTLYWAEGAKQKPWIPSQRFSFSNSDARLILLMRQWLRKFSDAENANIQYRLYIHDNANVDQAIKEWMDILEINKTQIKISYKKHKTHSRHDSASYKGLIVLSVRKSTWLNRRIELWTHQLTSYYLKKLEDFSI